MTVHHCALFVAPFLLLAVQIQPLAAEENYTGRDEALQISVPTSLASNASEVIVNTTVHVPNPYWIEQPLMPSWLATVIGFAATLFFALIFLFVCCIGFDTGGYKRNWRVLYLAPLALSPCTAPELGVERLRMEVFVGLQAQYFFFAIACLYGWTRRVHRLPGTLALLAVPWIGRNLHLNCLWACGSREEDYAPVEPTSSEEGCCSRTLAKLRTAGAIVFGKLENLDAVSDGLAVASAYFVTDEVQARFAASFTSSTGVLGWLCSRLGIGNLMLAALLYGTMVQGSLALWGLGVDRIFPLLAELGGFAEVSYLGGGGADIGLAGEQFNALTVALGRVCSESMVQALLQTSLVMAQGQSLVQQPVLAFSIALSCLTLAGKAAGMLRIGYLLSRGTHGFGGESAFFLAITLCAALTTLAVLAVVLLKLYASQSCESRLWGLTTGCVALT